LFVQLQRAWEIRGREGGIGFGEVLLGVRGLRLRGHADCQRQQ
jgi:hypothetical protein